MSGAHVGLVKHFRGERDFGSGATFAWFLRQVHERFPSDHLLVDGWDHGYGWHYFSWDATSGHDMTVPQLSGAIVRSGVHIDILAFDACDMADEDVADALATTRRVDYLVGSEDEIDQDGYPYANMFTPLTADPSQSPATVVADMLTGWQRYYGSRRNFNWVTLSGIDLARVRAMKRDLRIWTSRLHAGMARFAARYGSAMHHSLFAWESWQLDLGEFSAVLAGDRLITDAALRAASAKVHDDVVGAVIGLDKGSYVKRYTGLTVWAGTGQEWTAWRAAYRSQVAFGGAAHLGGTGWYGFLRAFNASGKADPRQPVPPRWMKRADYCLTDVVFRDGHYGWATGTDNTTNTSFIMRSAGSGGSAWQTSDLSAIDNYLFTSIARAPGGVLWAVGDFGWNDSVIVRSADGGRTWRQRVSGTKQYLWGVDFSDAHDGWTCGAAGTLVRTTDGGRTWAKVTTAPAGDLQQVAFLDATHGWVVANDQRYPDSRLEYTTDAGATWTTEDEVSGSLLYGLEVLGDGQVWAAGGDPASGAGVLLHGSAGGAWTAQWGATDAPRLAAVTMVDDSHGWAVGDGGAILHTTDGATWTPQTGGVTFDLTGVCAVDDDTAWAVGDGDAILRTTDGGLTWQQARGKV